MCHFLGSYCTAWSYDPRAMVEGHLTMNDSSRSVVKMREMANCFLQGQRQVNGGN